MSVRQGVYHEEVVELVELLSVMVELMEFASLLLFASGDGDGGGEKEQLRGCSSSLTTPARPSTRSW